jgi:hypothetical protein
MLMCVYLCILASSRIPDMILGDKPLISEVVLSQRGGFKAALSSEARAGATGHVAALELP